MKEGHASKRQQAEPYGWQGFWPRHLPMGMGILIEIVKLTCRATEHHIRATN